MRLADERRRLADNAEYFPQPDELRDRREACPGAAAHAINRYADTSPGGSVAVADRPVTQLGCVPGPGGRAIGSSDGRSVWRED